MGKILITDAQYGVCFDQVTVRYGSYTAIDDLSLVLIQPRIAIFGDNGSGKTTFARCATGVQDRATISSRGKGISIHGIPLTRFNTNVIWKHINMVFQIPDQQIIMPTVQEELRFGLQNTRLSDDVIKAKMEYALDTLGVLPTQACHTLSAGQKRMLTLLSIVLMEPRTIILDEPTTYLDNPSKRIMLDFIYSLPQQVIFITHDVDLVRSYDRAVYFESGRVACDGTCEEAIHMYKKTW